MEDAEIVQRASVKTIEGSLVLSALENLEKEAPSVGKISDGDLAGEYELVFSSALVKIPIINGFMPNKEIITFDLELKRLSLVIETLPFLPAITIIGQDLQWDPEASRLTYKIQPKANSKPRPPSTWTVFYADEGVTSQRMPW
eukprot:CAMPEP_0184307054 /NCGR_PEP_ID=MMETSP1049-20130417/15896_1 /TAXON_ID=77928 /ORGANISM="Proteomonas sulcata, Strain CCMP704" /LENGTH=142 /DNA_ID=CAMNT_0026619449 /DNA_START=194 /DNA_END=619 /DNA_ORIENTATION=+